MKTRIQSSPLWSYYRLIPITDWFSTLVLCTDTYVRKLSFRWFLIGFFVLPVKPIVRQVGPTCSAVWLKDVIKEINTAIIESGFFLIYFLYIFVKINCYCRLILGLWIVFIMIEQIAVCVYRTFIIIIIIVVVVVVVVVVVLQRLWYVLSCLWDGAYKRTLAANRKE